MVDSKEDHAVGPDAAETRPSTDERASQVGLSRGGVSAAELRTFLGQPDVQRRIRGIAVARLHLSAPSTVVDDIVQEANEAALAAPSGPRTIATASGWIASITARAVVNHCRRDATRLRWLDYETDQEALPDPSSLDASTDEPILGEWLEPLLRASARDQETYEMLLYKARTGKDFADVAADHGITPAALKSRIHHFKTTYLPRWREHQRERRLLWTIVVGAPLVVVFVWSLWSLVALRRPPRTEPYTVPSSASGPAVPTGSAHRSSLDAAPAPTPSASSRDRLGGG